MCMGQCMVACMGLVSVGSVTPFSVYINTTAFHT